MFRLVKPIQSLSFGPNLNQTIKFSSRPSLKLGYNPKVCIVGSGPAALYTAQYLLKNLNSNNLSIDVFEKLPVPFGLVRYGVAPDHQDVKNVINSFTETLKNKQVNFFGNVSIGTDLKIGELLGAYNSVVLAYGSMGDNYLNIPGEKEFSNVISARDIVSLYNGLPNSENLKIDLNGPEAVIIGAGNVAIDVARMLVSPIDKLAQTDISSFALDLFKSQNKIEHVSIVARRGVLNAAFTLKELRELTKLDSVECRLDAENFSHIDLENLLSKLARPRRRITEFLYNLSQQSQSSGPKKVIELKFLKTPLEILGNDHKQVSGVKFKNNKYKFDLNSLDQDLDSDEKLSSIPIVEDSEKQVEVMSCGLLVKSIGYKNVSIDSEIPFDKKSGVVPNDKGKVIGKEGLYCTGWIKRGPRGVIVDTTSDAYETAQKLYADLVSTGVDKPGAEKIAEILKKRNVRFVDKEGWDRIDQAEIKRGKEIGKPREKLQSIDEMLKVALEK
ncbi:NADPH:adrenodoxin mitochondrial [Brachionus plicatilis]|uniref:NADPH:adrenodoxin oxidoreductase, mitochondrial n=1 Tax=Brachionus plicatilis TaxID=10195 RepID=A0A3M7RVA7_BRAPC|nr:NADPH:adrenodoxin mitochondrial [Brachionus plicatilis]